MDATETTYTYTIDYDGGGTSQYSWDTEAKAIKVARTLMPGCVVCDEWQHDRKLIWATKADATGDDGSRAIAQITRYRPEAE